MGNIIKKLSEPQNKDFIVKFYKPNFDNHLQDRDPDTEFNIVLFIRDKLKSYSEIEIFQFLISITKIYKIEAIYEGIKYANYSSQMYSSDKLEFINQTYFKIIYSKLLVHIWLKNKIKHIKFATYIATLLAKSKVKLSQHIILDFVEFNLIKHGRRG